MGDIIQFIVTAHEISSHTRHIRFQRWATVTNRHQQRPGHALRCLFFGGLPLQPTALVWWKTTVFSLRLFDTRLTCSSQPNYVARDHKRGKIGCNFLTFFVWLCLLPSSVSQTIPPAACWFPQLFGRKAHADTRWCTSLLRRNMVEFFGSGLQGVNFVKSLVSLLHLRFSC